MNSEPLPASAQNRTANPRARRLEAFFAIDLRSLAAFRIGLGALLLLDLYGRAKTLRMHYTGEGVFPREVAATMTRDTWLFRVFMWSENVQVQTLLFGVFALLALLLLVGYRTRIVSVLVFVFLVSLVRRNYYVCHTGDALLKVLCFWAMFLPLGAHFSLDRLRSRWQAPAQARLLSLASAGVLLQIAVFYVMAGYLKSRYDVWTRGDAVWIFTHVIEYTRPFGTWLGQFPDACRCLTYATLAMECLAPFLLFFPFGTARMRTLLFLLLAVFHLTLQATIHIGIFQFICIAMLTLFLPSGLWEWLARHVPAQLARSWGLLQGSVRARFGREQREAAPAARGLEFIWARAAQLALAPVLAVVLVSNVNSAVKDPYDASDAGLVQLPQVIVDYGKMMSLVQSWNMFTDIDRLFFGWFLVVGQQEDGALVDVLEHGPAHAPKRPEHYALFFPNHNSRRYWRDIDGPDGKILQKLMCDYLAREWQADGRPALTHLAIFHVGRVPSAKSKNDELKRLCNWEAAHEPLKSAVPEVQQHWNALRDSWQRYLASLPKRVPADE